MIVYYLIKTHYLCKQNAKIWKILRNNEEGEEKELGVRRALILPWFPLSEKQDWLRLCHLELLGVSISTRLFKKR